MIVSPLPCASVLAAALAAGCLLLASLFVPESPLQVLRESSPRRLEGAALYSGNDPRTVQLRPGAAAADYQGTVRADAPSLWWEDIDFNLSWSCGSHKCFFLSLSDPANGYLIWKSGRKFDMDIYNYAMRLESEFGIRHFFTKPPYYSKMPQNFLELLTEEARERFLGVTSLVVQESRTAPAGSMMFRCAKAARVLGPSFGTLDYVIERGSDGSEQRLAEELSQMRLIMDFHPELAWDFQFMIDLEGRIWHLDLDRTKIHSKGRLILGCKICLDDAIEYVRNSMALSPSDPGTVQPPPSAAAADALRLGPGVPDPSKRAQPDGDASHSWWEDIDYVSSWQFDRLKRFFPSLSDPASGYLIWDRRRRGWREPRPHSARIARRAYQYAKALESEHNIRHNLKGPVYESKTPEYFAEQLTGDASDRFAGATALVIQESRAFPKGSMFFKCKDHRNRPTLSRIGHIIEHGSEGCEQRLIEELSHTNLLLESHPELAYKLEFAIDLEGRIHHVELDRIIKNEWAASTQGASPGRKCLQDAIAYIRKSS